MNRYDNVGKAELKVGDKRLELPIYEGRIKETCLCKSLLKRRCTSLKYGQCANIQKAAKENPMDVEFDSL